MVWLERLGMECSRFSNQVSQQWFDQGQWILLIWYRDSADPYWYKWTRWNTGLATVEATETNNCLCMCRCLCRIDVCLCVCLCVNCISLKTFFFLSPWLTSTFLVFSTCSLFFCFPLTLIFPGRSSSLLLKPIIPPSSALLLHPPPPIPVIPILQLAVLQLHYRGTSLKMRDINSP